MTVRPDADTAMTVDTAMPVGTAMTVDAAMTVDPAMTVDTAMIVDAAMTVDTAMTVDAAMTVDTAINEIIPILRDAWCIDKNILYAAEGSLKQLHGRDLPDFLLSLSDVLSRDESPRELERYIETILSLTTESLKGGVKTGALQCIEFWITICKKVIELRKQNKLDAHAISTVDGTFIDKSLPSLVLYLLKTLLKQEGDGDARSIFMSAMRCLVLVARTIGDAIVPLAMQFVEANIKAADWQSRKAATCALAVILEGPSTEKLAPVVPLVLGRMEDRNVEVRCTAVFTLRRVCELLHSPACGNRIFTYANLSCIVAMLGKRSKDVPEVSEEACRALYFLAKGYQSISSEPGHSKKKISSSELSPFLSDLFHVLVSTSAPAKETPFTLPTSAYKALCEVVRASNLEDYKAKAAIGVLMPRIMRRLNMVLGAKASSSGDKMNKDDHLVLLCGVLHVIIQKLEDTFAVWRTPFVLLLFCRVLTCEFSAARDTAALAIGALADATRLNFADHMPILVQYFNVKLLFPTYLRVIGNIFLVLGEKILPHCDYIMGVLYEGLSKSMLKPPILECFGKIALAIGKNFETYLQDVMEKLKEASNPKYYANVFDEHKVDYCNQLSQGILNCYSGILKGIKDPESLSKVAMDLVKFIEAVCKDQSRSASVKSTAVDVLSELDSMVHSGIQRLISEVKE